ncbi:hypothetical protein RJ498_002835, partial [Pluralibacter gergoviae]
MLANGINAGGKAIANVQAGTAATDAVNLSQLNAVGTVANKGWNITDGNTSSNIAPGGTVTITPTNTNLTVAQSEGTVTLGLSNKLDLSAAGSITAGNSSLNNNGLTIKGGPSVLISGINAGGKAITNVQAGTAATDAVNLSQLNAVGTVANKGWNITDGTTSSNIAPGGTVTITPTNTNMTVAQSDGTVTLGLSNTLDLSTAGSITAGNSLLNNNGLTVKGGPSVLTSGINAGGKAITNVQAGTAATDAVNLSQLNAVGAVANKGWNITDGKTSSNIAPGGTVTITPTNTNLAVEQANGTVTLGLANALNLGSSGSIELGNTRVNNGGLTIAGGPSIVTDGINAGGKKITNVLAGEADTDAVNVSQLKDIKNTVSGGWNVADGAGSTARVAPGDTVTFKPSNDNLTVAQENGTVTVGLANNLNLGNTGSLVTGNTVVNNDGLTIAGGPSVTTGGVNAGRKVITDVADGVASSDAVNKGQLDNAGSELTTKGLNLAGNAGTGHLNLGDTLTVKGEGIAAGTYSGKNLKTSVGEDGSLNIAMTESPTFGNVTINPDDSGRIGGVTDGVNPDDAVNKGQLDNVGEVANRGWNVSDAAGNSSTVKPGDTVTFAPSNDNLTVAQENGTVTVGLSDTLNLGAAGSVALGDTVVKNDGLTIANGPSITTGGISGGNKVITDVADGINASDAVNKGQLDNAGSELTNKGLNIAGNSGTGHLNLGDTLTVRGEGTASGTYSGKNLKTSVGEDGSLNIAMTESPTFGNVTINPDDSGRIGGVTDGVNLDDAVNKGQLDNAGSELTTKGLNIAGNSGTGHLNLGDTLSVKGEGTAAGTYSGKNLKTSVGEDGSLNIAMTESPTFGNVTINPDDSGRIGGVTDGVNPDDAVNKGQLDNVGEVANRGWNVSDAAGNASTVKPGDTVTFKPSNDNLTVAQENGTVTVGLSNTLNLGAAGSIALGDTVVNNDGLTIANGPSITTGGISGGNKVITDVADGIASSDAVNKGQLDNAGSELTTKGLNLAGNAGTGHLNLGDTLTVRGEGTAAGTYSGKNLKTSVGEDGSLNIAMTESPTFGNVTINPDDSGRIGGVTDGVNPDDAVNKGQLDNAGSELTTKGLNLAGNSGTGHLNLGDTLTVRGEGTAAGTYSGRNLKTSVGEDGSLNIAMTESPTFGNVTINPDDSGRIGGVTDGVNPDDAVNKGQLDNVGEVANRGWNVSDAAGNSSTVKPGDTVTFAPSNDNLTVAQADGTVTVGLANNLNLGDTGSLVTGNTTVNNDGLTIIDGPSITTGGISGGNKVITDVADGVASSDAVNKGQLDNAGSELTTKGLNIAGNSGTGHLNLGDTLTVKGEGTAAGTYSGKNLKTSVGEDGSLNIAMTESPTFGNVTINPDDSGRIGGVTDGVNPDDAVNKGQLDNVGEVANRGWNVSDEAGNSSTVKPGDTVTFKPSNDNLTVAQENGTVTVGLSDTLNLGAAGSIALGDTVVNNDGLTIAGGPGITTGGVNAGNKVITDVADGIASSDAVNKGQLDNAGSELTNKGLNIAGNSGTGHLNLGDTLTVKGEGTAAGTYSGKNLKTSVGEDGSLNIAMTESPTFGNVTINPDDSGRIGGVTDGVNPDDAVNKGQLDNAGSELTTKGLNIAGNSGTGHLNLGDTLTVRGEGTAAGTYSGKNLKTSVGEDGSLNIAMTESPTFGNVTINPDDSGRIGGVTDGVNPDDAVNKGQLDNVGEVANRGWNVSDEAGNTSNVKPGDTVTFKPSNDNLTVAQENGTVTVGLSDTLNLGAAGSIALGDTVVNNDGLTIAGGPGITTGGVNAGNKVITDVADGIASSDAVNKGQLDNAGSELTTKGLNLAGNSGTGHLNLGDTLTVKGEGTAAGTYSGKNLKTSVGEDGSLNIAMTESPTFGNVTINPDDSGRIGGVTDGVNPDDAVNKGQLDNVGEIANRGWNVSDAAGNSSTVKPGDTVTFQPSNDNLTVAQENGTVTVGLSDTLNLGAAGSIALGDTVVNNDGLTIAGGPGITTGGISGGNKVITDVADGIASSDAVNKGQLDNAGSELTNKGLNIAGNSGTGHLNLGDTLTVRGEGTAAGTYSGRNLKTSVGEDGSLNIAMTESPTFGNVTINPDDSGRIGGVTDGVNPDDAVNKGQLDDVGEVANKGWNVSDAAGNSSTVKPGDTVTFQPSNDNLTVAQADGTVTVGLSDTLNLGAAGSIALGDTVVNNDGLTIAGGPGITTGG